jgi:homoaconitase/3-isopropylmalate dehydratase large subunit
MFFVAQVEHVWIGSAATGRLAELEIFANVMRRMSTITSKNMSKPSPLFVGQMVIDSS